jgi:molybdenum cofactor cytidylyltransferase
VVPGVILAAGRSSRMGRPKALLAVAEGGPSFVRRVATVLLQGGVDDALVVGRPEDTALRREVETLGPPVRFVVNERADEGQLSSLVAGLDAADRPGVSAILVTLVDLPLIQPATVRALLERFSSTSGQLPIVRAVHNGRHGHPVIFSRAVFGDLRRADRSVGAKAVVRALAHPDGEVDVDDAGVLSDVDEPEDYARLFK